MKPRMFVPLLPTFLTPGEAWAEAGYVGVAVGALFVLLVFLVAPVMLLAFFIRRSIRRGKHEGHAEYKRKQEQAPPLGRMGE